MSEIIEILFEDVDLNQTSIFLRNISHNSKINNFRIMGENYEIGINDEVQNKIFYFLRDLVSGDMYIDFSGFEIKDIMFLYLGVHLFNYSNKYDLYIYFNANELIEKISTFHLKLWADKVHNIIKSKRFYCGYEQAIDFETRFFSKDEMGPLKDWNNKT
ncbi:hypothetical protein [Arsenicibacter rosenii]|uniref:STAS domain-containing protein n=1 Tax=Arsenicibacter rosenii TaxID=1750698 RepID=A0A1S2VAA8_9BACT|nr:hypothetical protein [Arsenicibacter rosenii]OIN55612.1 hypothetical protein BLX24_29160 [Arsenicibacter rosenii]